MNVFSGIFLDQSLRKYYLHSLKLRKIRKEFEHYLFFLYEKIEKIVEMRNKCYDIMQRDRGYIREDEKSFYTGSRYSHRMTQYYKRWANKRLKRIRKILDIQFSSRYGIKNQERDIAACIDDLARHFRSEADRDIEEAERQKLLGLYSQLNKLAAVLQGQRKKLELITSEKGNLSKWSHDIQKNMFDDDFMLLLREEIRILFNEGFSSLNYNDFQAEVREAIRKHSLPAESILSGLIEAQNRAIRENRKEQEMQSLVCYHARPRVVTGPVFPLDSRMKSTGFFVDEDRKEALMVVRKLYPEDDLELYQITFPEKFYRKKAIPDTHDESMLKMKMDNARIIRATDFPAANELYRKGLITVKKLL